MGTFTKSFGGMGGYIAGECNREHYILKMFGGGGVGGGSYFVGAN